MKDSEVLRAAKRKIQRGAIFICWAINSSTKDQKQIDSLTDWVDHMLNKQPTYRSWLYTHHSEIYRYMSEKQVRQGRLAWLDWMIDYCEKEEANVEVTNS